MKSLKPSIVGLSLMSAVLLFSCKKYDLQDQVATTDNAKTTAVTGLRESSWKTLSNWTQVEQPSFNLYYTAVKDANITADIANNGAVLVYKKDGLTNSSVQLPYEEKVGNTTYYWYYQVSEGKVLVSCDIYGSADAQYLNATSVFKYIPITGDVLTQLEGKGFSRVELMKMTYSQVSSLTSGTLQ